VNEIERIHQMVRDGRITAEEGERLVRVLQEVDEVDAQLDREARSIDREARDAGDTGGRPVRPGDTGTAAAPAAAAPAAAAPAAAEAEGVTNAVTASIRGTGASAPAPKNHQHAAEDTAEDTAKAAAEGTPDDTAAEQPFAPADTPWVRISMLAGDLDVRADSSLTEPHVSGAPGTISVERSGANFDLNFRPEGTGFLDRFLTQMRSGNVSVAIPEGYGVDLNMRAGDVRLHGVPYLRGRLTAGELSADALRGVDLKNAAGDIDVRLLLTEGQHRITSATGDVDIVLLPGSDVRVEGSVSIGDAESRSAGFTTERSGLGDRVSGTVGSGAALLEVHVTTGDVNVEVGHG